MSVLKAVNVKVGRNANLKGIINYVLQPKKTEEQLTTGFCCEVPKALETFMDTKQCFGKLKGRQYYHFVQSFPPNENITAKQAHEAAVRFSEKCKKFWGYEMIIVTHKDRDHIHTHFVMNSVSFIDGRKFHITRKELADMKELQNQISIELGYSAAPKKGIDMFGKKRTTVTANNSKTYHNLKKAEAKLKDSYLMNCSEAFQKALKMAKTKEQFIQLMHAQGFETEWKLNKKHITFTDIKRKAAGETKCKVRLNKLAQYFPAIKDFKTKEDLEFGIMRNESNSNRFIAAGNNTDKSEVRRSSEIIDFNSGYEEYSSKVDRERTVRPVEKSSGLSEHLVKVERGPTSEESKPVQRPAVSIPEKPRNSAQQNQERDDDIYSR